MTRAATKRAGMRKLAVLAAIAAAIWCGYWFLTATAIERGLAAWGEARRADGWVVEADAIDTSGFPYRFDTTVRGLTLADTRAGLAWFTPEFRFQARSHAPTHVDAIWTGEQSLATPYETITLMSDQFEAALGLAPGLGLALQSSSADLAGVRLSSDRGWTAGLERGGFSTRLAETGEDAHVVTFDAAGVMPARAFRRMLDPAGLLPERIEGLSLTATLDFDAPWDRAAIERRRPQFEAIELSRLRATWGPMDLRAAGSLTVTPDGVPEGRITVQATNWREMLSVAVSAGLLPEPFLPTAEKALGLLAAMSGRPDTIDAPLSFQKGFVSFGPFPLGPAPRLVLR